jgi:Kef-type K+ transport system membrane component KefB
LLAARATSSPVTRRSRASSAELNAVLTVIVILSMVLTPLLIAPLNFVSGFPNVPLIARAIDRRHSIALIHAGADLQRLPPRVNHPIRRANR